MLEAKSFLNTLLEAHMHMLSFLLLKGLAVGQYRFGVPFWGRCATHFRLYFSGDWDVHWRCGLFTHGHFVRIRSLAQSESTRPDLLVGLVWSIFSHRPKRLIFLPGSLGQLRKTCGFCNMYKSACCVWLVLFEAFGCFLCGKGRSVSCRKVPLRGFFAGRALQDLWLKVPGVAALICRPGCSKGELWHWTPTAREKVS